ncbi:hypothetical protein MRB53_029246 [Persea americana]|uniref:Uncharacterized protein n=1 Tax=Persea americana TaxID=3435 RepID=A0ACC2KI98_PERAE|nr:hypothetical protein MRB53_029246 [Persea americana]
MAGHGTSCGACKFLRRKCTNGCIFAPYFCYDEGATHFAAIHKVFGASNVSKLLSHLPMHSRSEAAITISYEAQARIRDPIYGCVAHIFALQQQVANLQGEIDFLAMQTQTTQPVANAVNYASIQPINNFCDFQLSPQKGTENLFDSVNQNIILDPDSNRASIGGVGHQIPSLDREVTDSWELHDIVNGPNFSEKVALDVMEHAILPNDTWFNNAIYPQL